MCASYTHTVLFIEHLCLEGHEVQAWKGIFQETYCLIEVVKWRITFKVEEEMKVSVLCATAEGAS